jgi:hypothetical protein
MHIHIKSSYKDNLSVYPSNDDDSVVIAILDDTIVTAIVLDLTKDVALKLQAELDDTLGSSNVEVIQTQPG